MPAQLIINADDFGASSEINSAIAMAHREGILTSASLMVAQRSALEAVSIAKDNPGLATGLHITLSNGLSALSADKIPALVDSDNRFRHTPESAGLIYYMNRQAKRQLRLEIEAQFEKFMETGLQLSHIDGHQHLHAHPTVLPIIVELAKKFGASGIRVPQDPFIANMKADRSRIGTKIIVALGHAYLAGVCRRYLHNSKLVRCERVIGSLMSGRMNTDYVIRMLRQVKADRIEVFFHPSLSSGSDSQGPNKGDLEALLDPALKQFIDQGDYELTTYPGLEAKERGGECI